MATLSLRAMVCLCCALAAFRLAADEGVTAMLEAMHDATRHLNYDGVFVYQRGTQLDTMRLVHMFDGEQERERLSSLSGPAREVIRDGSVVTCLFADDQAAVVEKNPPRDLVGLGFPGLSPNLLENYRFEADGTDRVAGRPTRVVAVVPQRADRYGYRLWIDEATKLLLKSVIVGSAGQVLEQVQFTRIDMLERYAPELLIPEITGSGFTWRTEQGGEPEQARSSGWQVAWVPPGFAMQEHKMQNMATSTMPVDHLVYSDGLAMVSVFIEALVEDDTPLRGFSARGAVNAFSRVAQDHQITVVGELPLPTVQQIAASVRQAP